MKVMAEGRDIFCGKEKSVTLLKSSRLSAAHPSDKSNVEVNVLELLERLDSDRGREIFIFFIIV
jgi:hypothetical protein